MTAAIKETQWLERVETLFLRLGIRSLSMDNIASELGISKKTLYQWVGSKDELVHKVLEHHIARGKTQCLDMSSKAANAIDEIFILLDSNSQELAQMKTNIINDLQKYHHKAWELIRKFQYDFSCGIVEKNLLRGRKEGLYRGDFDIPILARLHLAGAFCLFDSRLFPDTHYSRVELFREYILHFLHGIVSSKGLTYLKKKLY